MAAFNYGAEAELFPTRSRLSKRQPVSYKRFDTAAEAIRYAIEELAPELLVGAYLEVDEARFDGVEIRNLYASPDYPLPRRDGQKPRRPTSRTSIYGFSEDAKMTDQTIKLDQHRGMAAQKATELRRLIADVEANERALRQQQLELEAQLLAAPATTWLVAADKICYLLGLFSATAAGRDPRRRKLIDSALDDVRRLCEAESGNVPKTTIKSRGDAEGKPRITDKK